MSLSRLDRRAVFYPGCLFYAKVKACLGVSLASPRLGKHCSRHPATVCACGVLAGLTTYHGTIVFHLLVADQHKEWLRRISANLAATPPEKGEKGWGDGAAAAPLATSSWGSQLDLALDPLAEEDVLDLDDNIACNLLISEEEEDDVFVMPARHRPWPLLLRWLMTGALNVA